MNTQDEVLILAPWRRVFDAAAKVEEWPQLLAHYRYVTVLSGRGDHRTVLMAASRDGIPCRWQAQQDLDLKRKRIHYRHTRSNFTQGMEVWWILEPQGPQATRVLLTHAMPQEGALMGWFRQHVVGGLFVDAIAAKTLAGLKRHLEAK